MLSILTEESIRSEPETPAAQPIRFEAEDSGEFEVVLGRRQLASVLFVATVAISLVSSAAYVAGKSIAPPPKVIERVRVEPARVAAPVPAPVAASKPEAPVFADPRNGALYLQMGAVEKGISVIFVEGLRKRGFEAIAAPGPNENIFRVLIGPLDDAAAYQSTKQAVEEIGLSVFAKKYQQ